MASVRRRTAAHRRRDPPTMALHRCRWRRALSMPRRANRLPHRHRRRQRSLRRRKSPPLPAPRQHAPPRSPSALNLRLPASRLRANRRAPPEVRHSGHPLRRPLPRPCPSHRMPPRVFQTPLLQNRPKAGHPFGGCFSCCPRLPPPGRCGAASDLLQRHRRRPPRARRQTRHHPLSRRLPRPLRRPRHHRHSLSRPRPRRPLCPLLRPNAWSGGPI